MRQWMVDPRILCDKHLRGEYVEHLMFLGTFKRKMNIPGYVNNNLVEPLSLIERFDILKNEMIRRNFNAKKDLDFELCLLDYLKPEWLWNQIDVVDALDNLIRRCHICAARYMVLIETDWIPLRDNSVHCITNGKEYRRNDYVLKKKGLI